MPSTKSRFLYSRRGARPGFTLLELTIAMGIGMLVSGMALYAYVGANKAQAVTVGSNMLKVSGQSTLDQMYRWLNQSRKVMDRAEAKTYCAYLPIQPFDAAGLSPGPVSRELLFPRIKTNGTFERYPDANSGVVGGQQGTQDPNYDPAIVGNALMFIVKEGTIQINEEAASTGIQTAAFGTSTYRLHTYRLHLLYLAQRPLPVGAPPVQGTGVNWTYQLMHWDSLPFLDKNEVEDWMQRLMASNKDTSDIEDFITNGTDGKLEKLTGQNYAGALNLAGTTAAESLYELKTDDFRTLNKFSLTSYKLPSGHFSAGIKSTMRTTFGESFVAFDTSASGSAPVVSIKGVSELTNRVPAYADPDDMPYGFEVMVIGPATQRQVLLHLTLCARTQPGNVLMAETFQQIVQTFEY
jgi:hypothetical protein